jgi:CshA-type fibril repeat protein
LQNTQLTTTAADTPATVITDLGTSIVQEVAISGADVTGVDFAFDSLVSYDFGDLPAYYVATTRDVDGARHIIPVGSTLYLGTSRDADIDGVASLDASFDDGSGTDDEDGVVPLNIGSWTNGTAGGSVQVTVPSGSTGYLVGWIDFNQDGSLIDLGELVISQSVTGTGSAQTIAFDIPAGTITNLADESWLARFRLFPAAPAYPLFAYTGEASDGEVEDHLFQRFRQSSLGDRVWLDADADGVQDSGEWGIPGITVVLKDGSGNVLDTQVTGDGSTDVDGDGVIDAVGYYRFDGRTAGTYTVELTIPSKYAATYDPDNGTASPNGSATHVLTSNTHDTNVDFGLNAPVLADISGTVYFDANHDNAFGSGDTGLGAVTVQLWTDPNGDGDPSDGELVNEVLTRTDGSYRFEDMPAYSYVVVEVDPEGYVSDSDVAGAPTDNRIPVVLGVVDVTGRNFLDDGDVLHAIRGTVYNDNGVGVSTNNQFNAADTALAGVTVTLYLDADGDGVVGATDPSVDTQVTASNGGYSFPYLPDGNYLVVESDPTGFSSDDDTQGAGTDNLIAVTLAGADSTGNNFLDDEPTVSIGGTVWNDEGTGASADYTFSAGDTVIVGVTVELYEDTNQDGALDTGDVLLATVTTDVNGEYIFTGLYPGHYLVVETDPTGFLSDNDTQGHGLDNTIAVALGASDSVGNDFLDDELPVSLSGTVFNDDGTGASTDDTFDAADTVISGVTVDLYLDVNGDGAVDAGDPLVAVLTTDSNGDYSFTGLYAGDYLVVETDPTGFVSDLDTDGSATDNLIAVTLVVSDSTGNDFLDDEQVMTIRGTVFNDNGIGASANDAFNAADTRISGVTLKLYLDVNADGQLGSGDTLLATVATDSNGDYSFTGLYAGRYLVVETDPTGFGSDNDTQGVGTDNLIAVALSVGDSTGNDFLDDEQSGPVAVNDARYNLLPGPATLRSSSNDSDPNNLLDIGSVDLNPSSSGRQITLVVPNEGTWKVDNLGWVTFFPQAGFTLDPAPIPYTIRNTPGAVSNQATITLDYAPRATNDSSFGNAIGTAVTLAVVGNDLGGDTANPTTVKIHGTTNPGDPLVVPGQGTWSVNSTTGAITFTPQTGFTGDPQPIRYTVKDYQGNDSNAAVVTVDYVAPCTGFPLMLAIDDLSTPGIDHIVVDDSPVGTSTSLGPSNRLDAAATARGQLSFSGSTAKFSFVKIVATSKPFLTLNGGPDIQITASFRSSASGQIAVRATDGCYAVTAGSPYTMFSPIGGTTNGRVVFRETANGSNLPFATTGVTNNYTTPVAGSFSAGPNRSALFSAPYVSLTKQLNVTHSKANQLTTLTAGGKLVESRLAAEYRSQLAWALARTVFARPEWIWGTQSLVSRGLPLPTVAGVLPGGPRQVEAITTAIQPPMEESAMSHSASEKLNRNAALAVDQVMGVWGDLGDF